MKKRVDKIDLEKKIKRGTKLSYLFANYVFEKEFIDELIEKYPEKFNTLHDRGVWGSLFSHHQVSESLIEKNIQNMNDSAKTIILSFQDLSESFLERNSQLFDSRFFDGIIEIIRWAKVTPDFVSKHIHQHPTHNVVFCLKNNQRINQDEFQDFYRSFEN